MLFGQVWEDPDLSPRDRSLVTVASLITSGSSEQLSFHLGKARENGGSDTDLIATITHMVFYAGWPKAMSALKVARGVLAAPGSDHAEGRPYSHLSRVLPPRDPTADLTTTHSTGVEQAKQVRRTNRG